MFWRKNKSIDRFAIGLADELYSAVLPDMMMEYISKVDSGKASAKDKLTKIVDYKLRQSMLQIQQFRSTNKLGVYGKARLHLTFMQRLQELGYDASIAKKVNDNILIKTP